MNNEMIKAKIENCEKRISDVTTVIAEIKLALAQKQKLGYFEFDVHQAYINKGSKWAGAVIHFAGNNHTISEAELIYHKLGELIKIAKR